MLMSNSQFYKTKNKLTSAVIQVQANIGGKPEMLEPSRNPLMTVSHDLFQIEANKQPRNAYNPMIRSGEQEA